MTGCERSDDVEYVPAIATWSTTWNYGPGCEDELLAAYGIEADPDRTRYYRLLWDLSD